MTTSTTTVPTERTEASATDGVSAGPTTSVAAEVTAALVAGWNAIRSHHPDVPEAVVSMATGGRESNIELAHFAPNRWLTREGGQRVHEVFVTAESLESGAVKVFTSLLHEAAHARCEQLGLDDCSVSQYHNRHFRDSAAQLGMVQDPNVSAYFKKKHGFAAVTMTEETNQHYAEQINLLDRAIRATRVRPLPRLSAGAGRGGGTRGGSGTADQAEGGVPEEDGGSEQQQEREDRNYRKAGCGCQPPTVIRLSPTTLKRGTVMCAKCTTVFTESD